MMSVTVKLKDGSQREFRERGRAGGSWTVTVSYEGAFVIITDEWGMRTAFPAADVAEVIEEPRPRW